MPAPHSATRHGHAPAGMVVVIVMLFAIGQRYCSISDSGIFIALPPRRCC
jgi:hypothetical protein